MANVTDSELAQLASRAGFPSDEIAVAVAVALAESGGNSTAVNRREPDGSTSYGLWQINSVHKSLLASGNWRVPADNARMAFVIWSRNGQSWKPWGAYNDQRYRLFLARGTVAARNTANGTDEEVVSVMDWGELATSLTSRQTWLRVAVVLLGLGILAMLVLQAVLKQTDLVGTVKTVGKLAAKRKLS